MSRPLPALYDLAAGRRTAAVPGIVASAAEHRLTGLLWSAVQTGSVDLDPGQRTALAAADLANMAKQRRLWAVMADAVAVLAGAGIDAYAIKGVVNEARWYQRLGERPCSDVDLVIAPHHVDRLDEILVLLAPDHPAPEAACALVRRRKLQHVHFLRGGEAIDLHLDPFKLGIWTRQADLAWSTTTSVRAPDGTPVPVLHPALALVGALTHLNRDRFAQLGAYVEAARIVADPDLDWELAVRFVAGEGLEVPVWQSLAVVTATLGIDMPFAAPRGWRARVWKRLWPPEVRLLGDEARSRHRKRQTLLPLLARSRTGEALAEWHRVVAPPRELFEIHRGDDDLEGHGYVRRLTLDRLKSR